MPIIYRALNKKQGEDALANRPIMATDPLRKLTIQEHIDRGRGLTPFISCTRSLDIAKYYAVASNDLTREEPNIIIEINTDRISPHKVFDISAGKNPENKGLPFPGSTCMHCKKDKEMIIKEEIPKEAYRILHIPPREWATFKSPKLFKRTNIPELLAQKYGSSQASTSGGAHGGAGASGGASSSSFGSHR